MITTYFLNCISEDIYRHQNDKRIPAYYYIGLSSTSPSIDGTGVNEPSAPEYARVKIDNTADFGEVDINGEVANIKRFNFPESEISWGTISHYVIFDDPIEGNLLIYGELASPIHIPFKSVVSFPVGTLKIVTKNE